MIEKKRVLEMMEDYDFDKITICTVCSHTSLQIFYGAKLENFRTLGISVGTTPKIYDAFPRAKPDEFITVKNYRDIMNIYDDLIKKNVLIIPHGSFVEYLGAENFKNLPLPTYGNRKVLEWESDRDKQREWLESANIRMPMKIEKPEDIDRPVLVKFHGAKGGRGFFIAKTYEEFVEVNPKSPYTIQEYIVGTRYYIHYFYSPISTEGYTLSKGTLEMLGMDRRDEANIDEMYKLGSQERLKKLGIFPTFVVTGNVPVVIRESLLPEVFRMGENVTERSLKLFGGIIGPFCLESIITDKMMFYVFEISARIVAGTNLFTVGSPYAEMIEPGMFTGKRICREIRRAIEEDKLPEIIS